MTKANPSMVVKAVAMDMPGPCQVRNPSSEVIPNKLTQSIQGVMALRLFSDHQASPQLPAHHRSSMGSEIVYILQVLSHSTDLTFATMLTEFTMLRFITFSTLMWLCRD